MIELNTVGLQDLANFRQPGPDDFPALQFKKSLYGRVKNQLTKYCQDVFECSIDNIIEKKKYQYIDCKIHELKTGQNTANGLWHLDCSLNGGIYYENYIMVSGLYNTTEFVSNVMVIDECKNSYEFSKKVEENSPDIIRIKPCTLTRYWGNNVHRGVTCEFPEKRLLLRLVNTDHIMPSYKI